MSGIPPGNNLRSRLPGMLVKNVCRIMLGNVEICWRIPNFLKADRITLLGESALTCLLILWGIKISWLPSSADHTLYLVDREIRSLGRLITAPVSVGEDTGGVLITAI